MSVANPPRPYVYAPDFVTLTDDPTTPIKPRDGGGWTCAFGRTIEWGKYRRSEELRPYFDTRDMICKIKQDVWLNYQLRILTERGVATVTVDYESLKSLSMATKGNAEDGVAWLDAEDREAFDSKDITKKKKPGR